MRISTPKGAYTAEGQPLSVAPSQRFACPKCDAPLGERCRSWRMQDGQRLYIKGYVVKSHPERTALAREAGELP